MAGGAPCGHGSAASWPRTGSTETGRGRVRDRPAPPPPPPTPAPEPEGGRPALRPGERRQLAPHRLDRDRPRQVRDPSGPRSRRQDHVVGGGPPAAPPPAPPPPGPRRRRDATGRPARRSPDRPTG